MVLVPDKLCKVAVEDDCAQIQSLKQHYMVAIKRIKNMMLITLPSKIKLENAAILLAKHVFLSQKTYILKLYQGLRRFGAAERRCHK
jgi:hypothetical protein